MRALILLLLPLVAADFYKETQDFQYSRSTDGEAKQGYYGSPSVSFESHYSQIVTMRALILLLLPLVAADFYKETQDFQYSRSTDGEAKQGYYGSQTGNMGGNYEVAQNMDTLAQRQMKGLMTQVGSQLGIDSTSMGKGHVPNAMNSGSIYGSASAHGKASGVVSGGEDADLHDYGETDRHRGGYQSRHSGTSGQRYGGESVVGSQTGRNRYVANENARSGTRQYGNTGHSEYSSSYNTKGSANYGAQDEYREAVISPVPTRIVTVPNTRIVSGSTNLEGDSHVTGSNTNKYVSSYNTKERSSATSHYGAQDEHREAVISPVPTRIITVPNIRLGSTRNLESDSHVTGTNANRYVSSSYGGSSMNTNRRIEDEHHAENLRGEQSNVEVNNESYFNKQSGSRQQTASSAYDSYQTTATYEDRVVPVGNQRIRVYLRPGDLVRVPVEIATPVQTRLVVQSNAHKATNAGSRTANIDVDEHSASTYEGSRTLNTGHQSGQTHNADYYKTDEYRNLGNAETTRVIPNPNIRTSSAVYRGAARGGSRSTQETHNADYEYTNTDNAEATRLVSNPTHVRQGAVRGGSTHSADYEHSNLGNAEAVSSGQSMVRNDDEYSNVGNTGTYTTATKPKAYQSSYSYHKSWERQGTPYVIKPQEGAALGADSLVRSSANSEDQASSHKSSQYSGSRSTYGQQGSATGESDSYHSGSQGMNMKQMEEQLRNQMRAACPTCDTPKTKGYSASYSYSAQRRYGDNVDRQKRSTQDQEMEDISQLSNDDYFSQQTENLEQQTGSFDQNQDNQQNGLIFGGQGTLVMEQLQTGNLEQEQQLVFGSQGEETMVMEQVQQMGNLEQEQQLVFGGQEQETANMEQIQQQSMGNLEQEQQLVFGGQEQETANMEQIQQQSMGNLEQKNEMIEQSTGDHEQKTSDDFEMEHDGESRNIVTKPSEPQRGDIAEENVEAHLQDLLLELGANHRNGKEERTTNEMSHIQRLNKPYALTRVSTTPKTNPQEPKSFLDTYPQQNQNEADMSQISKDTYDMSQISMTDNDFTQQTSNNEQGLQFEDLTQQQNSDWTQQSSNFQQMAEKDTIKEAEVLQLSQNLKITETTPKPTTTTTPEPGFWSKVGNKIGSAGDKVKSWVG